MTQLDIEDYIKQQIEKTADESGYGLTQFADRIAKAKSRFFGADEWQRCPCDPDSDRACISDRCKQEIEADGHCHCNCYCKETTDDAV